MDKRQNSLTILLLTLGLYLNACDVIFVPTPEPVAPGLVETLAVQTWVAQQKLTDIAPTEPPLYSNPTPDQNQNNNNPIDTQVFLPSSTPVPTLTPFTLASTEPPCINKAEFVTDVTISDNTRLKPNQGFTKTWRLQNTGTCTWMVARVENSHIRSDSGTGQTICPIRC